MRALISGILDRGARGGKWVARFRLPGANSNGYLKETLGEADDFAEADGDQFLDFRQAQEAARKWFSEMARQGGKGRSSLTVGDVLDE